LEENIMGFASRGLGEADKVPASSRVKPSFEKRLFLRPGDEVDIVLLDDISFNVWEHSRFLKGDKQASKIKVTCPDGSADGDPKGCRICNAMLRHDLIGRQWRGFLTVVDLTKRTWKGKTYVDVKKLLPLDKKTAMILEKKRARSESLVGAQFHLYRTEQTASSVGDDWELIDIKEPKKRFKDSPQIAQTIEWEKKKNGTILTRPQALALFCSPYEYDTILAPDQKKVTYFLAYMGIDDGVQETEEESGTTVNYSDPDTSPDAGTDDTPEPTPKKKAAKKKAAKKKGVKKKKGLKKKR
jgi:hypothetical protein